MVNVNGKLGPICDDHWDIKEVNFPLRNATASKDLFWETMVVSDLVQISQIRDGKSSTIV